MFRAGDFCEDVNRLIITRLSLKAHIVINKRKEDRTTADVLEFLRKALRTGMGERHTQ